MSETIVLPAERQGAVSQILAGLQQNNCLVQAGAGMGKTTLVRDLLTELAQTKTSWKTGADSRANTLAPAGGNCDLLRPNQWGPVVVLTADRRRSELLEESLAAGILSELSPGGGRLCRSATSHAFSVLNAWFRHRGVNEPVQFSTGGHQDAWIREYLLKHLPEWEGILNRESVNTSSLRTSLRTLVDRASQLGLLPADLALLGESFGVDLWVKAAALYSEYVGGEAAFTTETAHLDSARMLQIAGNALVSWAQSMGNGGKGGTNSVIPLPLPNLVIVEDLQDFTFAIARFLEAMASLGVRVLATSNPDVAIAEYRGGQADLGATTAAQLQWKQFTLSTQHRLRGVVREVYREITSWTHNRAPKPTVKGETQEDGHSETKVEQSTWVDVLVGTSESGMATLVGDLLRRQHYLSGIDWQNMAVICRHANTVDSMRSYLERCRVPLAAPSRAITLSRQPVCAQLLELLGGVGQGTNERLEEAKSLLLSPLVGVDILKLDQFLWMARAYTNQPALTLVELLELSPQVFEDKKALSHFDQKTLKAVRKAQTLWQLCAQARQQTPVQGLWTLWEAADVGETWRQQALAGGELGKIADQRLDAVLKLFSRANFWFQSRLAVEPKDELSAAKFAAEFLNQEIEGNIVARTGFKEPGVEVMTAAQAAGGEWEVVVVVDLLDGVWPSFRVGDVLTRVTSLESVVRTAIQRGWISGESISHFLQDGDDEIALDPVARNRLRLVEEARVLANACSRAKQGLVFAAFENEEQALSPFVKLLVEQNLLPPTHDGDGKILYTQREAVFDLPTLIGMLRYQSTDGEKTAAQRSGAAVALALLARIGVEAADPWTWTGQGGISSDSPLLNRERADAAAKKFRVGPSSLQSAQDCPLKWLYEQIGGRDSHSSLSTVGLQSSDIGNIIHTLAEEFPNGQIEAMKEKFAQIWQELDLHTDNIWVQKNYSRIEGFIERLAVYLQSRQSVVEKLELEKSCQLDIDGITISGRIDRIEYLTNDTVRIVDIKTGKNNVEAIDAKKSLQLLAYQLAVRKMGLEIESAGLVTLAKPLRNKPAYRPQAAITKETEGEYLQSLTEVLESVTGEFFAGVGDDSKCRGCPFRCSCPAQSDALRWIE